MCSYGQGSICVDLLNSYNVSYIEKDYILNLNKQNINLDLIKCKLDRGKFIDESIRQD